MPTDKQIKWALGLEGSGVYQNGDTIVAIIRNQDEARPLVPGLIFQTGDCRVVKISPMTGPVKFTFNEFCGVMGWGPPCPPKRKPDPNDLKRQCQWLLGDGDRKISVVIVRGGSSPVHPDWVRSLRDQCAEAGVRFVFQGWGEWEEVYDLDIDDPDHRRCDVVMRRTPRGRWMNLAGGHGFHGERVVRIDKVGHAASGRTLDGKIYDWEAGE